ncbi:hypothetical protein AAH446_10235 [Erwinia sp. P6884]|uniref:hypothetical protein n=1 Tax=Erwinia sp. P6884 TaxID=3141450 RepID=UPI003189AA1A
MNNEMKNFDIVRKAIENEIAIDEFLVSKFKYKKKGAAVFKVARFKNKIPNYFNYLCLPLLMFYFIYVIFISIRARDQCCFVNSRKIFLSFTSHPKIKSLWRKYEGEVSYTLCVENRILNFLNHLSYKDVMKGYIKSIWFSLKLAIHLKPIYYLHLTSVLELVLFSNYLKKINSAGVNKLILTNHYDRWITICSLSDLFDIELIQHGLLDPSYCVKNKITNVKKLTCFNNQQQNIFDNNIFLSKVEIVKHATLDIIVIENDKCDVLIISNPFYVKEELVFYHTLIESGLKTLFRPHPLYLNDKLLSQVRLTDLCLDERFPDANLCLCRDSTLGLEYESAGYQVFWWDDSTNTDKIIKMV